MRDEGLWLGEELETGWALGRQRGYHTPRFEGHGMFGEQGRGHGWTGG